MPHTVQAAPSLCPAVAIHTHTLRHSLLAHLLHLSCQLHLRPALCYKLRVTSSVLQALCYKLCVASSVLQAQEDLRSAPWPTPPALELPAHMHSHARLLQRVVVLHSRPHTCFTTDHSHALQQTIHMLHSRPYTCKALWSCVAEGLVAKASMLAGLYTDVGVSREKLLFR